MLGDRTNMVYSGTAVTYGRGRAVIVGTGMNTEMGRIAGMLKEPPQSIPLQRELDRTGKVLGLIVIAIAIVMIAAIVMTEHITGASGTVYSADSGSGPRGCRGTGGIARSRNHGTLDRCAADGQEKCDRPASYRRGDARSANIIASDKTGTLTKNEMTVRAVVTASGRFHLGGAGYSPEGEVNVKGGGAIDDGLRAELDRALAVADRANNAVLQQHDNNGLYRGIRRRAR